MDALIIHNVYKNINKIKEELLKSQLFLKKDIYTFQATSKERALHGVITFPAEALITPLHLTNEGGFEGLWLINKILQRKLKFYMVIVICSSNHQKSVVNITSFKNIHATELIKIKNCLNNHCQCQE